MLVAASRDAYHSIHKTIRLYTQVQRDVQFCTDKRLDAPKVDLMQQHINFAFHYNLKHVHKTLHDHLVALRERYVRHQLVAWWNLQSYLRELQDVANKLQNLHRYRAVFTSSLLVHERLYHEADGILQTMDHLPQTALQQYIDVMNSSVEELNKCKLLLPPASSSSSSDDHPPSSTSMILQETWRHLKTYVRHYVPVQVACRTLYQAFHHQPSSPLHHHEYVVGFVLLASSCLGLMLFRFLHSFLESRRVFCRTLVASLLALSCVLILVELLFPSLLASLLTFVFHCFVEASVVAALVDKYVLFSLVWYLVGTVVLRRFPLCKFASAILLTHSIYLSPDMSHWWNTKLFDLLMYLHPSMLVIVPSPPTTTSSATAINVPSIVYTYITRVINVASLVVRGDLLQEIKQCFLLPRPVIESAPIQLFYESAHVFAQRTQLYQQKLDMHKLLLQDWSRVSVLTLENLCTIGSNMWQALVNLQDTDDLVKYLLSPMLQHDVTLRDRVYYVLNMAWLVAYALQPLWRFVQTLLDIVLRPVAYVLRFVYSLVLCKELTQQDEDLYETLLQQTAVK